MVTTEEEFTQLTLIIKIFFYCYDGVRLCLCGRRLGSVMVSMLAIGPKVRGLKLRRDDRFLRAIKIRRTHSFGREYMS
jgi:hypothetical protein